MTVLDGVVDGLSAGERREGQHELSQAVADAITHGHHLVAEAPTGSGKSLAYLAPAVASGLRVVVATSTIALQSQLVAKDLPTLRAHGQFPFAFALLKGRSNYVCRSKLRAAAAPDALFEQQVGGGFGAHLARLIAFAQRSDTGDRADIDDAIPNNAWAAVSCASGECPGKAECDDGDECFAEQARDRARGASILVVNHALYCAHLAAGGQVLPDHDLVILDEAHSFAENATSAFAGEIAPDAITRVATMLRRAGVDRTAAEGLNEAGRSLERAIEERDGTVHIGHDAPLDAALLAAAERLGGAISKLVKADDYAKRTAQLASGRLEVLRRLTSPGDDDVVWVEEVGRNRRLRIAPVSAGDMIGRLLLEQRPVIAVSATLGGEPPFAALAVSMGFSPSATAGAWGPRDDEGRWTSNAGRGYVALQTPSSFDWKAQGILYVGKDLPDPGHARDAWIEQAGDRLCSLVNAAGGRALVLCTSRANVSGFARLLRERTDHKVLAQGDADNGRLTRAFIDDETSVLVGTRSFWAGIDAAGAACVLVAIDRIPFPQPGDPLQDARRTRAKERGLQPFAVVDLPAAALVLAQGAGRLIRRRSDQGVVAVLDSRLATRDYRTQLLAAVPPLRRSVDLAETCAFLEQAAAVSETSRPPQTVVVPPGNVDPRALRSDLTTAEAVTIRNTVACRVCDAELTERCRDDRGTSAFLHEARVLDAARPSIPGAER